MLLLTGTISFWSFFFFLYSCKQLRWEVRTKSSKEANKTHLSERKGGKKITNVYSGLTFNECKRQQKQQQNKIRCSQHIWDWITECNVQTFVQLSKNYPQEPDWGIQDTALYDKECWLVSSLFQFKQFLLHSFVKRSRFIPPPSSCN